MAVTTYKDTTIRLLTHKQYKQVTPLAPSSSAVIKTLFSKKYHSSFAGLLPLLVEPLSQRYQHPQK